MMMKFMTCLLFRLSRVRLVNTCQHLMPSSTVPERTTQKTAAAATLEMLTHRRILRNNLIIASQLELAPSTLLHFSHLRRATLMQKRAQQTSSLCDTYKLTLRQAGLKEKTLVICVQAKSCEFVSSSSTTRRVSLGMGSIWLTSHR